MCQVLNFVAKLKKTILRKKSSNLWRDLSAPSGCTFQLVQLVMIFTQCSCHIINKNQIPYSQLTDVYLPVCCHSELQAAERQHAAGFYELKRSSRVLRT